MRLTKNLWKIIGAMGLFTLSLILGCAPLYQPGTIRTGKSLSAPLDPPPQTEVQSGFWRVEKNINIYHFEEGQGTAVLVLHGGPGFPTLSPWPGLQPLQQHYQFIYYHQRGCGKSTRPIDFFSSKNYYKNMLTLNKALGMSAHIADIERIRRLLQQKQLIIIGHSFGGLIAALYAAEFPGQVKKLILVTPADLIKMPLAKDEGLYVWVERALPGDQKQPYHDFLQRYFDYGHIFQKNESQLAELNLEFGRYYTLVEKTKRMPTYPPGEVGGWVTPALFFSMGQKHDYHEALKKIKAPTLLVYGNEDLIPISSLQSYQANIPSNRLEIIPRAGHWLYADQPDKFSECLRSFLEE